MSINSTSNYTSNIPTQQTSSPTLNLGLDSIDPRPPFDPFYRMDNSIGHLANIFAQALHEAQFLQAVKDSLLSLFKTYLNPDSKSSEKDLSKHRITPHDYLEYIPIAQRFKNFAIYMMQAAAGPADCSEEAGTEEPTQLEFFPKSAANEYFVNLFEKYPNLWTPLITGLKKLNKLRIEDQLLQFEEDQVPQLQILVTKEILKPFELSDFLQFLLNRAFKTEDKTLLRTIQEIDNTFYTANCSPDALNNLFLEECKKNKPSIEKIKVFERLGANLKAENESSRTALSLACEAGAPLKVIRFLSEDIHPSHQDASGRNAFMHACKANAPLEVIEFLAEKVVTPEKVDSSGKNALMHACEGGASVELIQYLVEELKIDPLQIDNTGKFALIHACEAGAPSATIQYLAFFESTERGMLTDTNAYTALMHLVQKDPTRIEDIRYLVSKGANVNAWNYKTDESVLFLACKGKAPLSVIQLLVENGADLSRKFRNPEKRCYDRSIFHIALESNLPYETLDYIFEESLKAKPEPTTHHKILEAMIECKISVEDLKKHVTKLNLDLKSVDTETQANLLMLAIQTKASLQVVQYLVEEGGIDLEALDKDENSWAEYYMQIRKGLDASLGDDHPMLKIYKYLKEQTKP